MAKKTNKLTLSYYFGHLVFKMSDRQITEKILDRKKVLAAVTSKPDTLKDASDVLKSDRSVVFRALKGSGLALRYASKRLQNDEKIVLAAVRENPLALQYASRDMKNKKSVVLAAVAKDSRALQFASKKLQKDKEVIAAAPFEVTPEPIPTVKKKREPKRSLGLFDYHHDRARVLKALEVHERLYKDISEDSKVKKPYQHVHQYLKRHGFYRLSYEGRLDVLNKTVSRINQEKKKGKKQEKTTQTASYANDFFTQFSEKLDKILSDEKLQSPKYKK